MDSKKLQPENSVVKLISWENKPIFTEIVLLKDKTHFHMFKGVVFGHKSDTGLLYGHHCLLLGILVFLVPFIPSSKYLLPAKKLVSITV